VSEKTCAHYLTHRVEISGTIIRNCIANKELPSEILMRKEISEAILQVDKIFIEE
jgi:ATP sulfurylase